jgi:ABC-type antimicrobial peptide transport system permease subunit
MIRFCQLVGQSLLGVTRARLRSFLTALGIAISSGALVSMVAFAVGLERQFELPIQQLGLLNDVEVHPGKGEGAVLDDRAVQQFEEIPGVAYAYPDFRISQLTIACGTHTKTTFALGLPREASLIGMFQDLILAGDYFSLGTQAEVMLNEKSLGELGFTSPQQAVGQQLRISAAGLATTQPGQFEMRKQELIARIVGVYRAPGFMEELGSGALLLPADTMRDLPGIDLERTLRQFRADGTAAAAGFAKVTVHADSPGDAFRVERRIAALGFQARAVAGRIQEARRVFVFLEVLLSAVGTVGLVVAGLGIMNTLLMSVMERYQEIGIYKAIGASDGDVRILFLTEAVTMGLAGGLAGLVLARSVCWVLQWAITIYATRQGVHDVGSLFHFPVWLLAGAVAYAVAVSLISGVYPATRAARVDPIRALRGR